MQTYLGVSYEGQWDPETMDPQYVKLIRNDKDFPVDCLSDANRLKFLRLWYSAIAEIAKSIPGTITGPWANLDNCLWVGGRMAADGSGGTYVVLSERWKEGRLNKGLCPTWIYLQGKEFAEDHWKSI